MVFWRTVPPRDGLLEMHAVVACQYPEGAVPPQPVQIHAPWKGAPANCSCRVGGEPSRRACLAAGALHNPGARPLRSPDDLRQCPLLRDLGAKSWAGVPLHVQGGPRTLVLFIDREDPDRFDDETLQRAELVCTYLGSALEMACVAEAQRQEVEVSNALLSIAHLIATERDANRILRTLNEVTLNCLSHSTAASFTWDGTGFAGVMDDGMPRPVSGASQLATTLRERKAPLLVENPRQSALIPQDLAEQMGDGPALVCPMLSHRGDLLGAMVLRPLHAMRQLPPRDIAVALGIARLGALAIDHAHLQEQVMHAERMKALGEMSAGVAHDLNNLLAAIMGNAQLALMNAKDTNPVSTAMETISRVCLEGAETIRRIHSITEEPHRAPAQLIDLAEVIRQAVQATRPHWDDRPQGQDVQVMLDLEAGLLVHGSAADLQEAIVHLITNAVDAMPEGGKLTLRCLSQHPWAILEVIDTGIGMEDAVRQRVFDPFFTTKAQRGHGLGLSMVYGIVHRHLGTIAVESAVGRGTTFTIGVPRHEHAHTSLSPAAPLPKLHVLVVDDESLIAETMAGLLRCLGHSVDTAPGGKEALEIWQAGTYDLVITDHGMRGMTGTELAQRLKEQAPHVPVLLITGWDIHQGVTENTRQVVDAVLQKPVSREELLRGMASALHAAAPRATQASGSRRVLVVDDHPAITRVIDEALSANGYTVECYADADAAIARLEKGLPDLVITDYRLEGASGVDLARMVKEKNRGIPVILITGWRPDEHDLNDIDLCLNKPFNVQELLDAAASLAQRTHRHPGERGILLAAWRNRPVRGAGLPTASRTTSDRPPGTWVPMGHRRFMRFRSSFFNCSFPFLRAQISPAALGERAHDGVAHGHLPFGRQLLAFSLLARLLPSARVLHHDRGLDERLRIRLVEIHQELAQLMAGTLFRSPLGCLRRPIPSGGAKIPRPHIHERQRRNSQRGSRTKGNHDHKKGRCVPVLCRPRSRLRIGHILCSFPLSCCRASLPAGIC